MKEIIILWLARKSKRLDKYLTKKLWERHNNIIEEMIRKTELDTSNIKFVKNK